MFKEQAPRIEQEKAPRPNILKDFEGCLATVLKVEGSIPSKGLSDSQKRTVMDGMRAARTRLTERLETMSPEEKTKYDNIDYGRAFVYVLSGFSGVDGFNRYSVLGSGEIGINRQNAIVDCQKLDQEYGIVTV